MKEPCVYFTDRTPQDRDPCSYWLWHEISQRAQSGTDVVVYLMYPAKPFETENLHSRIQLRWALTSRLFFRWPLFIQSLVEARPSSLTLIEPKVKNAIPWPLLFVPQLKQMGGLPSSLFFLSFSQTFPQKSLFYQNWLKACDAIRHFHPSFQRPPFLCTKTRVEAFSLDPHVFSRPQHWSLQNLSQHRVMPCSLESLDEPEQFLMEANETIVKNPEVKFIFLEGLGHASADRKQRFLKHPLAAHFIFPENLSASDKGYALFHSNHLMTRPKLHAHSSSLADLAFQIKLKRSQTSLSEKGAYGLL